MSSNQSLIVWKQAVVQNLAGLDAAMANFIRERRVSISFRECGAHVGAFWLPGNRIYLNLRHYSLRTDPKDPRIQSILIHEIRHLQQGFFTALSIYGELEAWQLQFRVQQELTGEPYHPNLVELMSLPLGWDRAVLRRAQALMQVYASQAYRSDLLPLYPWGRELKYRLGFGS